MAGTEYRCFVRGLAWAIDDRRLEEVFRVFGTVIKSKIIYDPETRRSKGCGFVTFAGEGPMNDAIATMSGRDLDGRTITVSQAQRRNGGDREGGGGYHGGYGCREGISGGGSDPLYGEGSGGSRGGSYGEGVERGYGSEGSGGRGGGRYRSGSNWRSRSSK